MPQNDLVGTVAAAEILGVSLPTLKRKARTGELPYVIKMPGETGAYLFDRAIVEAHRNAPTKAAS